MNFNISNNNAGKDLEYLFRILILFTTIRLSVYNLNITSRVLSYHQLPCVKILLVQSPEMLEFGNKILNNSLDCFEQRVTHVHTTTAQNCTMTTWHKRQRALNHLMLPR